MRGCEYFYREGKWGLEGWSTVDSFIQQVFIEHLLLGIMLNTRDATLSTGHSWSREEGHCDSVLGGWKSLLSSSQITLFARVHSFSVKLPRGSNTHSHLLHLFLLFPLSYINFHDHLANPFDWDVFTGRDHILLVFSFCTSSCTSDCFMDASTNQYVSLLTIFVSWRWSPL